ncbi:hypothetical protein [Desulfonema magnum]|uniref:Uncharacterized protein n=1 Tax=Desulfonema magnum TaxID=45655 RepID=A0A975BJA7_9BACT|nr:hypothetical protein [Desulfonema magnum]QTA86749.1 Uncharacterized protein dnm_027730 [Desulfonema magnum]
MATIDPPDWSGTDLGPNDFEADADGNVYGSFNGFFDSQGCGKIVRINSSSTTDIASTDTNYSGWQWQKAMAFDGDGSLSDGGNYPTATGNRLFVDQDFGWGSGGPDEITEIFKEETNDSSWLNF